MRSLLLSLLLAILAVTSSAFAADRVVVNGRRSEGKICEQLLKQTPIGSDVDKVVAFLNERLRHEGGWVPSEGNGSSFELVATGKNKKGQFQYDRIPDLSHRFREKWIGETLDVRICVDRYIGLPLPVWVLATWRFSREGVLCDLIVEKQADGP